MIFHSYHPQVTEEFMGMIPLWLRDDLPAKATLNAGYAHGGGWQPFKGFTKDWKDRLCYPDDPALEPRCEIKLKSGERVVMYDHAWVAVIEPDGSFEVCRMD